MSKKFIVFFISFIFFSWFGAARADVVINEFSSASSPEWVELKNTGGSDIDLASWKLTELTDPTGTPTEKNLLAPLFGTIPTGGVVTFDVSGLNNSGDSIGLYDGETEFDRVTFGSVKNYSADLSTPDVEKSGALIGGSWKNNQSPTKGTANPASETSEDEEEEEKNDDDDTSDDGEDGGSNDSESSSSSGSSSTKKAPKVQIPKVQIIATSPVHTGVPFVLQGTGTGKAGEKLSHGKYYWNFGDGDFREVKVGITEKFTHTYFYPGDYKVVFEYYPDVFTDVPDATAEITIKVIEPKVLISRVGNASDFFIEISNETDHNADISNWLLVSQYKIFTLPKNTILPSKRKTTISPKLSGFSIKDKNTLKLMTPQREIVFDYSASLAVAPAKPPSKKGALSSQASSNFNNSENEVPNQGLEAASLNSLAVGQDSGLFSGLPAVPIASFVFIGAGASAVYFIRKNKLKAKAGDDFEILDE
ncbi:MAG TPA: lamin tail domain-containing protein [Candidatus Paceibacterota bacterium]